VNYKRRIVIVCIISIVAAIFTAPVASADPPWPIVQNMHVPGITTTLDGDAVLSECYSQSHSRDYWSQTFNSFGQQIGSVENTGQTYVEACNYSAIGRDNRRFTLERTDPNQWLSNVVGYEGDQQLWSYTPSTSCSSGITSYHTKGIAGNGTTAYMLFGNGCGSDPMWGGMELVGLSMATGAVLFQEQMPSVASSGDLRPYLDGYVYYTDRQGFTYLNSMGIVEPSKEFPVGDIVRGWSLGANGELAVLYASSYSGCTQYLVLRNSNGTMYRSLAPSSGCMYQTVHVTPTGSAVVVGYDDYMYMHDFSLVDETAVPPIKKIATAATATTSVQIDVKGNILATDHAGVTVYSAMGLQVRRMNFVDYFPALSSVYFDTKTAFTNGTMYAVAQQYPPTGTWGDHPTYLTKVTAAEIGIDYPRGTFLGDMSNPAESFIEYVAMGDSFSSGEGVPPFESGTADVGVNVCHRSPKAYSRVLAQAEGFNLTHFAACSGAKADRITSTWPGTTEYPNLNSGELPQKDHASADTDLITMTIGGNDVPFEDFAEACISPLSPAPCDGQAKANAIAGIADDVIPEVQSNLAALSAHLNIIGSDAVVLVIGYPYLVPESAPGDTELDCNWLDPGEVDAIRYVTDTLNTAIRNEVEAIYNNFHFVTATDEVTSPFIGHELCRVEIDTRPSFFNDYVGPFSPKEYIAHPNEAGQAAYADLVKNWIILHPEVFN